LLVATEQKSGGKPTFPTCHSPSNVLFPEVGCCATSVRDLAA
jgi:hypothetical protein